MHSMPLDGSQKRSSVLRRGAGASPSAVRRAAVVLWLLLVAGVGVSATSFAGDTATSKAAINQRVHQLLAGHSTAGRIETVSGQLYLSRENLDAAVIRDALSAVLADARGADESVAVQRARRVNFEIHFPKNSADLGDEARAGLDELGEVLRTEHLETRFVLGGHTDLDGDAEVNGPLSQARADSARAYLIERFGIEPTRLEARGFGTSEPLRSKERNAQDKRYNRRVDLRPMGR